jgi:hypothetical protein
VNEGNQAAILKMSVNVADFIPGTISPELRDALGVPKGAPPPWQGRLHAFGIPFDYRTDIARIRSPERFVEVGSATDSADHAKLM